MEKQEMYSLYVQIVNSDKKVYSFCDGKKDESKRGSSIMEHNTIEGLDAMTGDFSSFEDINNSFKELYKSNKDMYRPVIYVDKDINDLSESYYINDIVYREDLKILENKDYIKTFLLDYLKNNPAKISEFGLLRNFYVNVMKTAKVKTVDNCLTIAVNLYLQKEGYMGYRNMYFKLKQFNVIKVDKNEKHR